MARLVMSRPLAAITAPIQRTAAVFRPMTTIRAPAPRVQFGQVNATFTPSMHVRAMAKMFQVWTRRVAV
jgi:hypothetical protein